MPEGKQPPLQAIAMHGWGRDARTWEPWQGATASLGWRWQTGERGYGRFSPRVPAWPEPMADGRRLLIGRSLGPHMVPADVFREADTVVLLASFATFVAPGRVGRRTRAALDGMAACLKDETRTQAMLEVFTARVAEPQSPDNLRPGPWDGSLSEDNRARLREDLDLLARCDGLPSGFPRGARVLIVEAEEDRIVEPEARALLREALPEADVISVPGVGHALLSSGIIARVVEWAEARR